MSGLLRRPWARAGLAAAACGAAVGLLGVFGAQDGHPAQDVRLLSGSAWLASGRVGQLTLLDGLSAEVSAQVQVAPVNDVLEVVQQGSTAYAVNKTAGTIRRLDGATFELTGSETPIPGAGAGLTAFAGEDALYVLDTRRGLYATADPKTGRALTEPKLMSSHVATNTTGIDGTGRLWIIDNETGDLVSSDSGGARPYHGFVRKGRSVLAMAKGRPVVVDTEGRRAMVIDPDTGTTQSTIDIDVRPDEEIQVSGSPHDDRIYVVTPRGVLTNCELAKK
jgi:hypothetical protein